MAPRDLQSRRALFNQDSGQVYTETVIPTTRAKPIEHSVRRIGRSGKGASSLQDIALHYFLENADSFTPEHVLALPFPLQERVWINAKDQFAPTTLILWKLLATASPEQEAYRYLRQNSGQHDTHAIPNLPRWMPALASPNCDWLTALTLGNNVQYNRVDLIRLAALKNLVALDVCSTSCAYEEERVMDDGIIKAWGRHAKEADAFQELRVIIIRNERGVTPQSLRWLSDLPSLALFGVQGCKLTEKDEAVATQWGWTTKDEHSMLDQLKRTIDLCHSWDEPLHTCVKATEKLALPLARDPFENPECSSEARPSIDPPLFHMRLGSTCGAIIFGTPIMFFRAIQSPPDQSLQSTAYDLPQKLNPLKRTRTAPKLRPSRRIALSNAFDFQGFQHTVGSLHTPPPYVPSLVKKSDMPISQPSTAHSRQSPDTNIFTTSLSACLSATTTLHRSPTVSSLIGSRIHSVPAKKIKRDSSAASVLLGNAPASQRRERTIPGESAGWGDGSGAGALQDEKKPDTKDTT